MLAGGDVEGARDILMSLFMVLIMVIHVPYQGHQCPESWSPMSRIPVTHVWNPRYPCPESWLPMSWIGSGVPRVLSRHSPDQNKILVRFLFVAMFRLC